MALANPKATKSTGAPVIAPKATTSGSFTTVVVGVQAEKNKADRTNVLIQTRIYFDITSPYILKSV